MAAGKEITHEEHIYDEAIEMSETLKPVNSRNANTRYGCRANVNDTHAGYDNVQLPQSIGIKRNDTRWLKCMTVVMVVIAVVLIAVIIFLGIREGTGRSLLQVNGRWSVWGSWSECSASCGTGMASRNRSCSNPKPSSGGDHCLGDSTEYRVCNTLSCPVVNGGWSNWEPWGPCSATCGNGMNRRVRSCSNPTPSNGGNFCYGESSEYRLCNTANCQVIHGGWSYWTSWTSCSSSCTKTRTRNCTNPAASQDSHMCQGDAEVRETCNLLSCVFGRLYVRLTGGSSGRVEVSLDTFNWGTVCDDDFDPSDAQVVCRMLGNTGNAAVINSSAIVDGSGPIFLDNLACYGNETSLLYCQHVVWGKHDCGHGEDVGVSCG